MFKKTVVIAVAMAAILATASRAQAPNVELLYAIVSGEQPQYDNADHWVLKTSMRMWMTKFGQETPVYLLSCYFNAGEMDTRRHEQRVDLVNPQGEVIFTTKDQVELTTIQDKQKSFQRAYVVTKIIIPALDTQNPKNFGMYNIKIYLDGDLAKKYSYPILAR